jgi:hypothetical protein
MRENAETSTRPEFRRPYLNTLTGTEQGDAPQENQLCNHTQEYAG